MAITLEKRDYGFRARYAITQADLAAYLDDLWARDGQHSAMKRGEMISKSVVDRESHQREFGDLGWPFLEDATEYYGPMAQNGAGFHVWYSAKTGMAYENAGYW